MWFVDPVEVDDIVDRGAALGEPAGGAAAARPPQPRLRRRRRAARGAATEGPRRGARDRPSRPTRRSASRAGRRRRSGGPSARRWWSPRWSARARPSTPATAASACTRCCGRCRRSPCAASIPEHLLVGHGPPGPRRRSGGRARARLRALAPRHPEALLNLPKSGPLSSSHGRALPREHPRPLQAAAPLRPPGRVRPRVRGHEPVLRRRAARLHRARRRRPGRGGRLRGQGLRDLDRGDLDAHRGARAARPARSCCGSTRTSSSTCSGSTSRRRG